MEELKNIIESLLFVSDEPLSLERIKSVIGFAEPTDIRNALQALSEEYDRRGGGFSLRVVAGGYQLRTRPEHKEYIKRLVRSTPPRLSRAALETLASWPITNRSHAPTSSTSAGWTAAAYCACCWNAS